MVSNKSGNQAAGAMSSTLSVGIGENYLQDVAISAIRNLLFVWNVERRRYLFPTLFVGFDDIVDRRTWTSYGNNF